MREKIENVLKDMGDTSSLKNIYSVSGGDISEAYRIITSDGQYFFKYNGKAPNDFFQKEAEGLRMLRNTDALQVPLVYHWSHESHSTAGYILMEWLEGEATVDTEEQLGQGLAHLHFSLSKHGYGLTSDNYIGTLPQPNGWREDWVTFLRDQRLGFQANLAEKQGMLRGKRKDNLYRLLINLEKWIPHQPGPSMLHGDLWGGNWMTGPKGAPYLIDPAVFYGDREFEIAFTELFGGYSSRFYDAYREISPLPPEYEERKHIYQLYYLLVHLNLFGESYGSSIDRVLSRYV